MCINIQNITYMHPDKEVLFSDISFSIEQGQKVALIGNNGSGKSTLLQVIKKDLQPFSGEVIINSHPYYIPQHFGQYDNMRISEALNIETKLKALYAILGGDSSLHNFTLLDDDWTIEERAFSALRSWGLEYLKLDQKLSSLSGGEKTKVFLSGISIHEPDIILFDEPTNHLDFQSREMLYDFIESSISTIIVVSHDRKLLNLLNSTYELNKNSISFYAGNYDFYRAQKQTELTALQAKLEDKEKQLRLARKTAREVAERKQKHEARGKKNNIKKGVGKMAMDTLQDKAEKSASKLKDVHIEKMGGIMDDIIEIKNTLPDKKVMKTNFNPSLLHTGKILVTAKDINFSYVPSNFLWNKNLNFQIKSGERIAIKGINGSGKSTLIKLITGMLNVTEGALKKTDFKCVYLDQNYSLINDNLTVFEQLQQFNSGLQDSELKTILNRFLFSYDSWNKLCVNLSGGEKMKLTLCCLMVSSNTPDMFILDEPTNNIDIQNIDILTETIKDYYGTLLIVSHDQYFMDQVGIDYSIEL